MCRSSWVAAWRGFASTTHPQLLEALLEHPAFAPPAKPKTAADQAADAVNQMGDNLKKVMGGGMPGLKGLKKPSWMK